MAPTAQQQVMKSACIYMQKIVIVIAAVLGGCVGWGMLALVLQGRTLPDMKEMDAMSSSSESAFVALFLQVLLAALALFALSFLGCIGTFRDNKGILLIYSVACLIMGIILTMAAVQTQVLLSASVPPIVMETNRICRNIDNSGAQLGCNRARLLQDQAEPSSEMTVFEQVSAAGTLLAWSDERLAIPKEQRRLSAGTTEVQLVERVASSRNMDKCVVLAYLCTLPRHVPDMVRACTCNGKSVAEMARNTQADKDWVCPQPFATQHAPDECGSFCADWDGSGDLERSWCFVNLDNHCVHKNYVNETYGVMEPSNEACRADTMLANPWSGLVSRAIYVAQLGLTLTTSFAALMYIATFSAWLLIWCMPGNKFTEQMQTLTCDVDEEQLAGDNDDDGMSAYAEDARSVGLRDYAPSSTRT